MFELGAALQVEPIAALSDNYIWALRMPQYSGVWVVDPGEARPVLLYLKAKRCTLDGILITHHHWDHVGGVAELLAVFPVPVLGSIDSSFPHLSKRVADADLCTLSEAFPKFKVLALPGHTLDHLAYYGSGSLFCGDTLFAGGCGRVFEGTFEQLYNSLQKIAALDPETKIYCAHEYTLNNLAFALCAEPSNMALRLRYEKIRQDRLHHHASLPSSLSEELETNPFLRCDSPALIAVLEAHVQRSLSGPLEVFKALRTWKNDFKISF